MPETQKMKDIPDTVNDDVCTVAMLWVTITSALCLVQKVTVCMGHYYYVHTGTACPVQIGAHHHIDVYTDINYLVCLCSNNLHNYSSTPILFKTCYVDGSLGNIIGRLYVIA